MLSSQDKAQDFQRFPTLKKAVFFKRQNIPVKKNNGSKMPQKPTWQTRTCNIIQKAINLACPVDKCHQKDDFYHLIIKTLTAFSSHKSIKIQRNKPCNITQINYLQGNSNKKGLQSPGYHAFSHFILRISFY